MFRNLVKLKNGKYTALPYRTDFGQAQIDNINQMTP
jgi:hypothetical protein